MFTKLTIKNLSEIYKELFRFLGSIYFAIVLIVCTLIFVLAGTFLESVSGSHLFAASFTYHNPIFQLLFWLYFINILFAALSRYPFERKHIPFLLTHLGLLLLLLGVFVKNHFGVQGVCALAEGSGTSSIFLPQTYALHIENPEETQMIELNRSKLGPVITRNSDLQVSLIEWMPHTQESVEGFIKGSWAHIVGLPPFEVKKEGSTYSLQTPQYDLYAFRTDHWQNLTFPGKASLFFVQDSQQKDYLIAFNAQGERYVQPISGEAYFIYNKGYGGYAVFADLPNHFAAIDLIAPLTRRWTEAPLPKKREDTTPCVRLLATSGESREIVTLSYDPFGQKFKWPILDGKYLARFQASRKTIPVHLRLQKAQQINYPDTDRPYSYEAEMKIDNETATLSMNHVYEKNGYRFYLANLLTAPSGVNQVQIVVNYDPAKYWLTYPGAIILATGIILLYFQKRYV